MKSDIFDKSIEPLLQSQENKYTFFPVKYQDIYQLYKTSMKNFWTVEEVDLSKDRIDWKTKLNDSERYFIKHILAFFAGRSMMILETPAPNNRFFRYSLTSMSLSNMPEKFLLLAYHLEVQFFCTLNRKPIGWIFCPILC